MQGPDDDPHWELHSLLQHARHSQLRQVEHNMIDSSIEPATSRGVQTIADLLLFLTNQNLELKVLSNQSLGSIGSISYY